jgi:hypothetical protein
MQDLQLIGVHEDGEHLLLSGPEGERYQMLVDDALRAAIRRDRPRLGQLQMEVDGGLRPRDVQALIRAGSSSDEAARRAGWSVEKVHRFEGPILAEREHVAGLAQGARLRSHTGTSGGAGAPTLSARVTERLKSRDVEVTDASWDSWRTEGGPWTVVLTFAAGGHQRQASWSFDLADRTVTARDDEARWLSEEVQETRGPIPALTQRPSPGRETTVYDVEAEGGLRPHDQDEHHDEHHDEPLDLMTAMRKRSTARSRRRPGARRAPRESAKASVPDTQKAPPALPLEELEHDREAASTPTAPDAVDLVEEGFALDDPMTGEPVEKSATGDHSKPRPKRPAGEATRRTGRPTVPAWDEIMFGSRPGVDR